MSSPLVSEHGAEFFPKLRDYLSSRILEWYLIPSQRKLELEKVAEYVRARRSRSLPAKLTFVCTHNSRRSQLAQVWAHVAAEYYGINLVETYSGGTEATAFNPRAVAALHRAGLHITCEDTCVANPHYQVRAFGESSPQVCFSKLFDESPNPTEDYCAVMTCSQADEACPVVLGCDLRMPIRYEDPKVADGTDQEENVYDERSRQICREMLYLTSMGNKQP